MLKMKFKLIEKIAYHYGDLDVAKKADRRAIMGGRGTGHFGTGFYMVSFSDPSKAGGYNNRALWEIDLDQYNLFKPKSNNEAYKLHDSLKVLNSNIDLKLINKDRILNDVDEFISRVSVSTLLLMDYYSDKLDSGELSEDDIDDMLIYGDYNEKELIPDSTVDKVSLELRDYLLSEGIDDYTVSEILLDFEKRKFGAVEQTVESYIDSRKNQIKKFNQAVIDLSSIFGKDVRDEAIDAILSKDQEDSKSTVFMKSLGYEGIDVTHLNKSDPNTGTSGLDNFTYGSVIYDLKPGTYKKIKEKESESLNEVYPNKGESKKDFISRFMSVTKDEYPDQKQRFAIANSYWERRNK